MTETPAAPAKPALADKPAGKDPALKAAAAIAKALWKAEQKAASPAVTAETLKAGWPAVREARVTQMQAMLGTLRKAGLVPEARPEGEAAAKPERARMAAIAKALWKADQKAADPKADPKALSARWQGLRKSVDLTRKTELARARALLRAVAKTGYRLEALPEGAGKAAKAAKADKPAKADRAARKAARKG